MLSRGDLASDAHLLEELVRASFGLAQKQVGALIAIQRVGSLSSWADEGHEVDSRISAEILQSFFHPTSPVHDGAVVIVGPRIAAAGVFLPISFAKSIPKSYGTRHRAAIGLTEITDALCVLVSEERGTVAVVEGGIVRPVADPNDLRERLQQALGLKGPAPEARPVAAGAEHG
jgi:diadenylate cyclase